MNSPSENSLTELFLTAKQVRQRYGGVSAMWLFRREHDASGFPLPVVIAGRKLFKLSELEAWERSLATKSSQASHLTNRPHDKDADKNEAAAST